MLMMKMIVDDEDDITDNINSDNILSM